MNDALENLAAEVESLDFGEEVYVQVTRRCFDLARHAKDPLALWVVGKVFEALWSRYEGRPADSTAVESISNQVRQILHRLGQGGTEAETRDALVELIQLELCDFSGARITA